MTQGRVAVRHPFGFISLNMMDFSFPPPQLHKTFQKNKKTSILDLREMFPIYIERFYFKKYCFCTIFIFHNLSYF